MAEDRAKDSLAGYVKTLTLEPRDGIRAVAMDMGDAYIHVVREYVPQADSRIVFDHFHKRKACGFRNRDHFRIAIFFHCGGLQLYPATHGKP